MNNCNGAVLMSKSPGSSTTSQKTLFCRICHEGESGRSPGSSVSVGESLISPCSCAGTVGLIHLSCLEHWLTASNTDRCEICQFVYKTSRVPRTCRQYLRDGSNQFNVRNLIADLICFTLLTPLLIVSTYLCVLGASQYFMKERWEAVGLIILSLFLLGVYFTWVHVTVRYHNSVWLSWQRTNQQVRILLTNDESYAAIPDEPTRTPEQISLPGIHGYPHSVPITRHHPPIYSGVYPNNLNTQRLRRFPHFNYLERSASILDSYPIIP